MKIQKSLKLHEYQCFCFNGSMSFSTCLKAWDLNAIMKQLVQSACVSVCVWIMQRWTWIKLKGICESELLCLVYMLTFIVPHSLLLMCGDACVDGGDGGEETHQSCWISTSLISLIEATAEDISTTILHTDRDTAAHFSHLRLNIICAPYITTNPFKISFKCSLLNFK